MKILVVGAGVLGSLYAARLYEAGNDVTVLARGNRAEEIRKNGIILENSANGQQTTDRVTVIEQLSAADYYDLALILVRRNQLESVLPVLAANKQIPTVVVMCNNASGFAFLTEALGKERVVPGFPGAGGQREGSIVRYMLTGNAQPTTIGELDGTITERILKISDMLRQAGLPVEICPNMDAWLKTHAALVSPLANAIYMAGGDNVRLANTRDAVVLIIRAVREGFRVLHRLNIPITPARYRVLKYIPEPLLVAVLQNRLRMPIVELMAVRHANAARDEMQELALEFRELAVEACLPTPAVDNLFKYMNPETPAAAEGRADLSLDWYPVGASVGLAVAVLITMGYIVNHLKKRK
jgi:2-dehydropantoate 2-reductase